MLPQELDRGYVDMNYLPSGFEFHKHIRLFVAMGLNLLFRAQGFVQGWLTRLQLIKKWTKIARLYELRELLAPLSA